MAGSLFWLSDEAWARIEPHLPKNQPGARRVDDRRVISGIIHMLKCGGRWADCPAAYGPSTTVYNRWNRWSRRGLWRKLLATLSAQGPIDELAMLDSTYVKAHRSAHGGKGGAKAQAIGVSRGGQTSKIHAICDLLGRPVALALTAGHVSDIRAAELLTGEATRFRRLVADKGYDADRFRRALREAGTMPVIPGRINRKRRIRHDERRYRDRWLIEAMFCRLKDFRRVATRYDKLAANFLSAAALAAVVTFWL